MLPEGWQEGDVLFDGDPADETTAISGEGPVPTTEPESGSGDGRDEAEGAPTTEPGDAARPNTLKFRARVDRQDLDVELDERELPTIYQKAQVTDRVQAKLARMSPLMEQGEALSRRLGYDGLAALLSSAEQGLGARQAERTERSSERAPAVPTPAGRDFQQEARALLAARPELKGTTLPDSVHEACRRGRGLLEAYTDYEMGRERAETERLRRENAILRQNAAAAARAPIRGTGGGGGGSLKEEDDFLRGFHFDD